MGLTGLIACGGKSTSSPSDGPSSGIPLAELAERLAAGACESLSPCCAAQSFAYDETSCTETGAAALTQIIASFDAAKVKYDAMAARACVDAYVSALNDCSEGNLDWELPRILPPLEPSSIAPTSVKLACARVFSGTVPMAGACRDSIECAPAQKGTAFCDLGSLGTDTCSVFPEVPRGGIGEACAGDCIVKPQLVDCFGEAGGPVNDASLTTRCYSDDGLYCSFLEGTGRCGRLAAQAEPCTAGGCGAGLFCSDGQCAPTYASGPCGATAENPCDDTSYCDSSLNQCAPKQATGDPCGPAPTTSTNDTCQSGYCQFPRMDQGTVPHVKMPGSAQGGAAGNGAPPRIVGTCTARTLASDASCSGHWD